MTRKEWLIYAAKRAQMELFCTLIDREKDATKSLLFFLLFRWITHIEYIPKKCTDRLFFLSLRRVPRTSCINMYISIDLF